MNDEFRTLYLQEEEKNDMLKKIIEYLSVKNRILNTHKNIGERDELLLKLEIYHLNETKQFDKLHNIFGEEASSGISILNLVTNEEIQDINQISKASSGYKADCKIKMKSSKNEYYVSIKSKNGANPAILNHTPRSANVFKNGELDNCLPDLDNILAEYIYKRENKEIGEDIPITSLDCLKTNILLKNTFIDVLKYFTFNGTGKGKSRYPANAIMTCEADKITFIKCVNEEEKKEYIESIYENIILSLRDKGMPKKVNLKVCEPWVFCDIKPDGSIKRKGSLHIRIK